MKKSDQRDSFPNIGPLCRATDTVRSHTSVQKATRFLLHCFMGPGYGVDDVIPLICPEAKLIEN